MIKFWQGFTGEEIRTIIHFIFYTKPIIKLKFSQMKFKQFAYAAAFSALLFSCKKENASSTNSNGIPDEVLNQIRVQGFSTDGVIKANGGYIVENDIFLSNEQLQKEPNIGPDIRVGEEEQYRTTNLIKGLPRTITVSMNYPNHVALLTAATDTAIARYNALNLRIKFQRISGVGEIDIVGADLGGPVLGGVVLGQSSGFPSKAGNPASPITLNSHDGVFTDNTDVQWLGTILAHEMGHTIGFRHTDYKNRRYSCGLTFPWNEGTAGVGAIYIPGTEKTPKDKGSWMLACTDGTDRPFNPNDIIALKYLYK